MRRLVRVFIALILIVAILVVLAISLKGCSKVEGEGEGITEITEVEMTETDRTEIKQTCVFFNKMVETMSSMVKCDKGKTFWEAQKVIEFGTDEELITALQYMEQWYEVRLGLKIEKDLSYAERAIQLRNSWNLMRDYHEGCVNTDAELKNTTCGCGCECTCGCGTTKKSNGGGGTTKRSNGGGTTKKQSATTTTVPQPKQGNQVTTTKKADPNPGNGYQFSWDLSWITKFDPGNTTTKKAEPDPGNGYQVTTTKAPAPAPGQQNGNGGNSDPEPGQGYQNARDQQSQNPAPAPGQQNGNGGNSDPEPGQGYQVSR